ncbi:MAG: hypothetical protein Q7T31_11560 [Dietzia sp.]|uniref:hypothetical protein n=1 Tax=Dietzia sp. TaxID=1871616 RepID=UPI0027246810|nr:hypothetical protein [Dietzia sp.]MDO8395009.1 hypothetical protein [Dietzia sp.]
MTAETCRHTDPMTGVVAEVGTDGVPVGLAVPAELLDRAPADVARAVLRTLTAAACEARELLDRLAEQEWDGQEWDGQEWDGQEWELADWDDADRDAEGWETPEAGRADTDDGPTGGAT